MTCRIWFLAGVDSAGNIKSKNVSGIVVLMGISQEWLVLFV